MGMCLDKRYFFKDLCWWKLITEIFKFNERIKYLHPQLKKNINRSIQIIGRGQRFLKKKYRPITHKLRYTPHKCNTVFVFRTMWHHDNDAVIISKVLYD